MSFNSIFIYHHKNLLPSVTMRRLLVRGVPFRTRPMLLVRATSTTLKVSATASARLPDYSAVVDEFIRAGRVPDAIEACTQACTEAIIYSQAPSPRPIEDGTVRALLDYCVDNKMLGAGFDLVLSYSLKVAAEFSPAVLVPPLELPTDPADLRVCLLPRRAYSVLTHFFRAVLASRNCETISICIPIATYDRLKTFFTTLERSMYDPLTAAKKGCDSIVVKVPPVVACDLMLRCLLLHGVAPFPADGIRALSYPLLGPYPADHAQHLSKLCYTSAPLPQRAVSTWYGHAIAPVLAAYSQCSSIAGPRLLRFLSLKLTTTLPSDVKHGVSFPLLPRTPCSHVASSSAWHGVQDEMGRLVAITMRGILSFKDDAAANATISSSHAGSRDAALQALRFLKVFSRNSSGAPALRVPIGDQLLLQLMRAYALANEHDKCLELFSRVYWPFVIEATVRCSTRPPGNALEEDAAVARDGLAESTNGNPKREACSVSPQLIALNEVSVAVNAERVPTGMKETCGTFPILHFVHLNEGYKSYTVRVPSFRLPVHTASLRNQSMLAFWHLREGTNALSDPDGAAFAIARQQAQSLHRHLLYCAMRSLNALASRGTPWAGPLSLSSLLESLQQHGIAADDHIMGASFYGMGFTGCEPRPKHVTPRLYTSSKLLLQATQPSVAVSLGMAHTISRALTSGVQVSIHTATTVLKICLRTLLVARERHGDRDGSANAADRHVWERAVISCVSPAIVDHGEVFARLPGSNYAITQMPSQSFSVLVQWVTPFAEGILSAAGWQRVPSNDALAAWESYRRALCTQPSSPSPSHEALSAMCDVLPLDAICATDAPNTLMWIPPEVFCYYKNCGISFHSVQLRGTILDPLCLIQICRVLQIAGDISSAVSVSHYLLLYLFCAAHLRRYLAASRAAIREEYAQSALRQPIRLPVFPHARGNDVSIIHRAPAAVAPASVASKESARVPLPGTYMDDCRAYRGSFYGLLPSTVELLLSTLGPECAYSGIFAIILPAHLNDRVAAAPLCIDSPSYIAAMHACALVVARGVIPPASVVLSAMSLHNAALRQREIQQAYAGASSSTPDNSSACRRLDMVFSSETIAAIGGVIFAAAPAALHYCAATEKVHTRATDHNNQVDLSPRGVDLGHAMLRVLLSVLPMGVAPDAHASRAVWGILLASNSLGSLPLPSAFVACAQLNGLQAEAHKSLGAHLLLRVAEKSDSIEHLRRSLSRTISRLLSAEVGPALIAFSRACAVSFTDRNTVRSIACNLAIESQPKDLTSGSDYHSISSTFAAYTHSVEKCIAPLVLLRGSSRQFVAKRVLAALRQDGNIARSWQWKL